MYAIVDCNNFYASCERLFNPKLWNKPIVVLSNNDGCVIARSNEAKEIGIKMGDPYFQIQKICKRYKIHVFSSNYAFYGDMSRRVMSVLEANWPETEVYSIDEAFLELSGLSAGGIGEFCNRLQSEVKQFTGIPVSIGIGQTKTLAKLANYVAKKQLKTPVFNISSNIHWLSTIAVDEIWGVGRKWSKKLHLMGIHTAQDLANFDSRLIKRRFNVVLERTALELRGIKCIELEETQAKQQIISSKSFGQMQTHFQPISEALSNYAARAVEKLRRQHSKVGYLSVFITTNRFRKDLPQYSKSIGYRLVNPSDDIREITLISKMCLKHIFKEGYSYKKTGIMLGELSDKSIHQETLFDCIDEELSAKKDKLMTVFDKINRTFGRDSIKVASAGKSSPWAMKSAFKSPNYTTRWRDLPIVIIH